MTEQRFRVSGSQNFTTSALGHISVDAQRHSVLGRNNANVENLPLPGSQRRVDSPRVGGGGQVVAAGVGAVGMAGAQTLYESSEGALQDNVGDFGDRAGRNVGRNVGRRIWTRKREHGTGGNTRRHGGTRHGRTATRRTTGTGARGGSSPGPRTIVRGARPAAGLVARNHASAKGAAAAPAVGRVSGRGSAALARTNQIVSQSAARVISMVAKAGGTVAGAANPGTWVAVAVGLLLAVLVAVSGSFLFVGAGAASSESNTGGICGGEVAVPAYGQEWVAAAAQSSQGLPPWYLARIIERESDWRPDVFANDSNGGTWGLFQINRSEWARLHPETAGQASGIPAGITDPLTHSEAAGRLLRGHYDRFEMIKQLSPGAPWASLDPLAAVVIMHNAGEGALMRYPAIPAITQDYVAEVMASDGISSAEECGSGVYAGDGGPIVDFALVFQGVPYVWGGTTPSGFDCSGLMQYTYSHFGVSLPRVAHQQAHFGQNIYHGPGAGAPLGALQPGDMIAFSNSGGANYQHIGMYIGAGQMVHAPQPGSVVNVTSLEGWKSQVWRVQRVATGQAP